MLVFAFAGACDGVGDCVAMVLVLVLVCGLALEFALVLVFAVGAVLCWC